MPRSWATCAIGRFDSNTRRTARSRNSSGYFLGLDIAGASPSARTEPGIGASKKPRVLHITSTATNCTGANNSINYAYDTNGNQTAIGARSFAYDLANHLTSTTTGGTTTNYGYDGDDRRISS